MKKSAAVLVSIAIMLIGTACASKTAQNAEPPASAETAALAIETEIETDNVQQEQSIAETQTQLQELPASATEDNEARATEQDITEQTDASTENTMKITVGDTVFSATFAHNSSAEALKELLREEPLTIDMHDYASMEKVGPIGTELPTNDEQITTGAGDIILYQGNSLVIYYNPNSWEFTRIGKINDVTQKELLDALGSGNVTVTFSLE